MEINLNLGCPSNTVVSKNRGSEFLACKNELEKFLDEIFDNMNMKISIKTRLGKDNPEEFYELINIFNKYPMEELIIHPRTQKDFYGNKPNMKIFNDILSLSKNEIVYNGDINDIEKFNKFEKSFKSVNSVMIGRGLLANSQLVSNIKYSASFEKCVLKEFHNKLYEEYKQNFNNDVYVLRKMKELWFYMIKNFNDDQLLLKKIRQIHDFSSYDNLILKLF